MQVFPHNKVLLLFTSPSLSLSLSQVHWETRYRIGQFDIENKNCMHSHTMKWHIRYLRSVSQCLFYWSFIFFSDDFPFKFWDFSQWTQNPTISRIRRYTFVFSKIKYNWTSNCTSKRFAKMNEASHKNFLIKNCFSVASFRFRPIYHSIVQRETCCSQSGGLTWKYKGNYQQKIFLSNWSYQLKWQNYINITMIRIESPLHLIAVTRSNDVHHIGALQ